MPSSNNEPPDGRERTPSAPDSPEAGHFTKNGEKDCLFCRSLKAEQASQQVNGLQDFIAGILAFLFFLPIVFCFSIRFLFFHREITFRDARLIRATLLHDREWPWWQFGFTPWFSINWMLMMFDEKKASLAVRIKSGQRALDAFSRVRSALMPDDSIKPILRIWDELQIRDEQAFNGRDRNFFMDHYGDLLVEPARIFFETVVLLRTRDYLVFKCLCCKTTRFLEDRIKHVGVFESKLVTYFISHRVECCLAIQHFRQTLLRMIRKYIDNMIAFCLQNDLLLTAHLWTRAGRCIVCFQETESTDENESYLTGKIDEFHTLFKRASEDVYVRYLELDKRLAEETEKETVEAQCLIPYEPPPDDIPAQQPVAAEVAIVANDEWTAFYGRDIYWYHISDDGYTISDTTTLTEFGKYRYEYCGITENSGIVRDGLAFFFADFEKNCEAQKDEKGDWIVTRENDFIKMSAKKMKKFKDSLRAMPGMATFIPDVLMPKGTTLRADGKANNRSGKYRIDPRPGSTSDSSSCQPDAVTE